jgi:hypothetical protein
MAAAFGAAGDQDVGAGVERGLRHRFGLHLADDLGAGRLDARRERGRVAEREPHRTRAVIERDVEQMGLACQAPGDEADAERAAALSSSRRQHGELLPEPRFIAVAAAQEAVAAGFDDRHRQPRIGDHVHRRQHDRVVDAQAPGQNGLQQHGRLS